MNGLLHRFDQWLFSEYALTIGDLALYRIVYCVWALLNVPSGMWLINTPHAFFNPPPGLPALMTALPAPWVVIAVNMMWVVALVALLFGWQTKSASIVVVLCSLVLNTWTFSLGKINHDILSTIVPLILAFSGWGDAYSIDNRRAQRDPNDPAESWTVAVFAFIIGFAMLTAGWTKLSTGWLNLQIHSTYGYFISNHYATGREWPLGILLERINSPIFWESLDWAVVLLECGFILAVYKLKWFRIYCALACMFHIGVWFMFNIVFETNTIAYAAVVPFHAILALVESRMSILRQTRVVLRRVPVALALGAVLLAAGVAVLVFKQSWMEQLRLPLGEVILLIGVAVATTYLVMRVASVFQNQATVLSLAHVRTKGSRKHISENIGE